METQQGRGVRCGEDGWMREEEGAGTVGRCKDTKQKTGSEDSTKVKHTHTRNDGREEKTTCRDGG